MDTRGRDIVPGCHAPVEKAASWLLARFPHLDPEDTLQEAWLFACEAVRKYEEGRAPAGSLEGWVYYRVKQRLWEHACRRRAWVRRNRRPGGAAEAPDVPAPRRFSLRALLGEVSTDARRAVLLACEGMTARAVRDTLESMGWSLARIAKTFREVRDAL